MYGGRGMLGKQVVFRKFKDFTVAAKPPVRVAPSTDTQKLQQSKFLEACAYAKLAKKDATLWEKYEAMGKAKKQPARNFAIKDYLCPPKLSVINTSAYKGAIGSKISIVTFDDFEIRSVAVKITKADDTLVESGNAIEEGGEWVYTTTIANAAIEGCKVIVEARDLPGNITTKEVIL